MNIMHSKRRLLSNYFDFLGKKVDVFNKKDIYLMEETRDEHMPIVEDDLGTHVFSGYTLVSFEEIKQLAQSGIRHVRIDGIFHDLDYVCKALSLYQAVLSNEMSGAQAKEEFDKCYPDAVSYTHLDVYKRQDEAYILNKGKIVYHATRENIGEESLKDIFFTYTDREVGDEA